MTEYGPCNQSDTRGWRTYVRVSLGGLPKKTKAPLVLYALTAVCLGLSQSLGKVAFKYLNYATGTILKSAKLVPTLLISVVYLKRAVPRGEWAAAVLLVTSAALMALGDTAVGLYWYKLNAA
jgi:adenosine 3'-phospho 5'-phosphosulfate transporter B3